MKNPLLVGALVVLLCFTFGCQKKAEKAELEKSRAQAKLEKQNKELAKHPGEEPNKGNAEKHGHEQDAGILDAPAGQRDEMTELGEERDNRFQPAEKIMDAIGLKPGMVIGEVGAGYGRFTVRLAKRVGKNGLVYANDIDKRALGYLEQRSKRLGLGNIRIILGQVHDPCFPPRSLDMAFMINVYNAFEDPVRFLRNIAPALKPGGTLAIVLDDPAKSGGESERSATREELLAHVDKAGYKVEKEETFLERDGLYVLRLK